MSNNNIKHFEQNSKLLIIINAAILLNNAADQSKNENENINNENQR
jgi:hypothetical protein